MATRSKLGREMNQWITLGMTSSMLAIGPFSLEGCAIVDALIMENGAGNEDDNDDFDFDEIGDEVDDEFSDEFDVLDD